MAESRIALYGAIGANVAIAATKFAIAGVTGSSAMLSEGIHSAVDTCNGVLLLVGTWRSERPPSDEHPFGHGKELYPHDPLTGLFNRRGFLDQALPVYSTSMRSARPLAVVMIDIDHFKRINDLHGHDAGDRTLVAVAEQLGVACRRGDVVARWGGEEFVMLLPETSGERARALAERLREIFAGTVVPLGDGGTTSFTASFGVAVRAEASSLEDVIRASDAALYAAKDAGRDRVFVQPATPRSVAGAGT